MASRTSQGSETKVLHKKRPGRLSAGSRRSSRAQRSCLGICAQGLGGGGWGANWEQSLDAMGTVRRRRNGLRRRYSVMAIGAPFFSWAAAARGKPRAWVKAWASARAWEREKATTWHGFGADPWPWT
ncbi:hypothetical protein F4777DRAFT_576633 [Nemania sp. FL0916]|nr:hypothetical protein F4777DRAFT_576633 [Nemania sp. FL0916]